MAKYNNKASFTITGVSEILKKIEKAKGNVNKAVEKAIEKSAEIPAKDMLNFIKQHRDSGATEESFVKEVEVDKDGNIICYVGFKIDKTHNGLAAIFLNVGGQFTEPTFFIDNAVENNLDKIHEVQQEVLNDILKELM